MASRNGWPGRSSKTHFQDLQWDDVLPVPKLSFSVASALVFCLSVLCFVNSLNAGMIFDDERAILKNRDVLPETPLADVFSHDFWGQLLDNRSHKSYRPLTVMTFRWNYAWAGGFHPQGFHFVNVVLHGVVSVIFLAVFSVLMSGYQVDQKTARPVFASPRAALLCAVLFAVHPIHSESVAGVVGRADLLCALAGLMAFLLYARSCCSSSSMVTYRPESFSLVSILASMCLCAVSTFCKEQGITVIGICSVFDIVVVCGVDPFQLRTNRKRIINDVVNSKKKMSRWVKSLIKRHLILFLTGMSILITRIRVMGSTTPIFTENDNPHSFVNGTMLRILNYNYIYAMNAWLLLNPWWLCCDWSMGCIPVITSLADSRILADIALWVVFGALCYHCCLGELTRARSVLIMSVAVLGIPFLPASNLFFRVGFVIAERILYLSCAGFCMLVVLGARHVCLHLHSTAKQLATGGFTLLVLVFVLRSMRRCQDYGGRITLYTSALKVCPLNAKVHYNMARALVSEENDIDSAIEEYSVALKLSPHYVNAMNNLALIFRDRRQFQEAEELLERAVSIRPSDAESWQNLGVVRVGLQKMEPAEASFLEALRHRRMFPNCLFNLGNLYKYLGRHTEAIAAWRNVTQINPTYTGAWKHTVMLLQDLGKYDRAIAVGKEALKFLPDSADLLISLASVYTKAERYEEGERLLHSAIERNQHPHLHHSLGMLYYRWGKNEKARTTLLRAKQLSPSDSLILKDLQMLNEQTGEK
ncbi:protein O-mannosyl-transferase TMTC4-like [Haliotis asinina]|uniref:protein O-mannosyl-transferase TMTC4-like n=1 Tax=Haliotis asinina TaxID=109174 RepID=UPI0035324013